MPARRSIWRRDDCRMRSAGRGRPSEVSSTARPEGTRRRALKGAETDEQIRALLLTATMWKTLQFDWGKISITVSPAACKSEGFSSEIVVMGERRRPRSSQSSRRRRDNPCDLGPGRADGRGRRRSPGRPEDRSWNVRLRPGEPLSFDCEHWGRSHDGIRGLFPGGRGASAPLASWVSNMAATAMNAFDCLSLQWGSL